MTAQQEGPTPGRSQAIDEIEELYGGPWQLGQALDMIADLGYAALTDEALQQLVELQCAAWEAELSSTTVSPERFIARREWLRRRGV
jgi:hypothetical protein